MAIKIKDEYPGQHSDSDPTGYPDGAPRNDLTEDDGTGTPLEQRWLRDWEGFKQSLLYAADIEADGTPDKVGASQILEACQTIFPDKENTDFVLDLHEERIDVLEGESDDYDAELADHEARLVVLEALQGASSSTANAVDLDKLSSVDVIRVHWSPLVPPYTYLVSVYAEVTNSASGQKGFTVNLAALGNATSTRHVVGSGTVFKFAVGRWPLDVFGPGSSAKQIILQWQDAETSGTSVVRATCHYYAA